MCTPEKKLKQSDLEFIAKQLLQERYILTALEFYTEITEGGQEISLLRDYFSNPSNFEQCSKSSAADLQVSSIPSSNLNRSSSQTTLDSLDWARYSEDGERILDDRIAVLEFELRKAKETIQGLRDNLTQATTASEVNETFALIGDGKVSSDLKKGDLKPHEESTLNFLINEYLVMRNYKMTANTFADENNNQDFENWDDIGLNIPRPPSLIQWLQEKVPGVTLKADVSCQTDLECSDLDTMKVMATEKELHQTEVKELQRKCELQEIELQKLLRTMSLSQLSERESLDVHGTTMGMKDDTSDQIEINRTKVKYVKNANEERLLTADKEVPVDVSSAEPQPETGILKGSQRDNSLEESRVDDSQQSLLDETLDHKRYLEGIATENDSFTNVTVKLTHGELATCSEGSPDLEESLPRPFEANDVIDPSKCNRLQPLGASSECGPQGVLAGEFISAQREEARNLLRSSTERECPQFLETRILDVCLGQTLGIDSRLQNQVAALSFGHYDLLDLVASSLHNIAPNVILAKREELLPLLVYSISKHDDSKERERLLHLLFNLTKKPDKEQRSTILLGLVSLARVLAANKLEAELLPQCWEQLSHKHMERRLLVAQSVGVLAPYTPSPLRNSLLLSMLQQLLGLGGEKETPVREAALASLALLVAYLDDPGKIPHLVDTLLLCLQRQDTREESHNEARLSSNAVLVLNALAHWSVKVDCFPQFLDLQIDRISDLSKELMKERTEGKKVCSSDHLTAGLANLVHGLAASVPFIFLYLYESLPLEERSPSQGAAVLPPVFSPSSQAFFDEVTIIIGSREETEQGLVSLHQRLTASETETTWSELAYIRDVFFTKVLEILSLLDASSRYVISSFVDLISRLCSCLGSRFQQDVLTPLFLQTLHSRKDITTLHTRTEGLTNAVMVVYVVAILSDVDARTNEGELHQFLANQISHIALSGVPTQALHLALLLLIEKSECRKEVLGALWTSVVHKEAVVRAATAPLWTLMVGHLKEVELASRVIPALVTLATDSDVTVRASVVTPLSLIIANSSSKEVKDKVSLQLDSLCEEAQVIENPPLQMAIAQTCTSLGHNTPTQLLHNLFLPCLRRVALEGRGSTKDKLTFGTTLLEALTTLSALPIPDHLVEHFVLPSLQQLQKTLGVMSFEHMETIAVLEKEYKLRAQLASSEKTRGGSISSLSGSLSANLGTMGVSRPLGSGVEDVKNRMSKMLSSTGRSVSSGLQSRGHTLGLPTLFKK